MLSAQNTQEDWLDSIPQIYPFINEAALSIQNANALRPFYDKLRALDKGERWQVRIAHIGDSHVQADYFPSTLRKRLQHRFGNAGRGLVFYYKQADTHGPLDYRTKSTVEWSNRRRIFQKNGPPIGISGMGIATPSKTFELQYFAREEGKIDRITLFHNVSSQAYQYTLRDLQSMETVQTPMTLDWASYTVANGDTLFDLARRFGCSVQELQKWNKLPNAILQIGQILSVRRERLPDKLPFSRSGHLSTSMVNLPQPISHFSIHGESTGKSTAAAQVFGALLEDTQSPGVLYNMMGVNGATFYRAEQFNEQLAMLDPDLILITLGTNEALQKGFDPKRVEQQIHAYLTRLKANLPEAQFLIIANPDVLMGRKTSNPQIEMTKVILEKAAQQYGMAFWDLYDLMGGKGSIRSWQAAELANRDFIHFTKKGYILLGHLLHRAIMEQLHAGN